MANAVSDHRTAARPHRVVLVEALNPFQAADRASPSHGAGWRSIRPASIRASAHSGAAACRGQPRGGPGSRCVIVSFRSTARRWPRWSRSTGGAATRTACGAVLLVQADRRLGRAATQTSGVATPASTAIRSGRPDRPPRRPAAVSAISGADRTGDPGCPGAGADRQVGQPHQRRPRGSRSARPAGPAAPPPRSGRRPAAPRPGRAARPPRPPPGRRRRCRAGRTGQQSALRPRRRQTPARHAATPDQRLPGHERERWAPARPGVSSSGVLLAREQEVAVVQGRRHAPRTRGRVAEVPVGPARGEPAADRRRVLPVSSSQTRPAASAGQLGPGVPVNRTPPENITYTPWHSAETSEMLCVDISTVRDCREQRAQPQPLVGVQAVRRLVEDQQFRIADHRRGERHPLPHAAGEGGGSSGASRPRVRPPSAPAGPRRDARPGRCAPRARRRSRRRSYGAKPG